jgi:hypothetical protein
MRNSLPLLSVLPAVLMCDYSHRPCPRLPRGNFRTDPKHEAALRRANEKLAAAQARRISR